MTLLSIAQNVIDEIGGFSKPTSLVNNTTDADAVRLLALAQRSGKHLARKHPFRVLQEEHTFTLVNGTAAYSLPSDFDRFLDGTLWNRTDFNQLRGSVSPRRWQVLKSAITTTNQFAAKYRMKSDSGTRKIFIDPTPDAADSAVFEYISNNWCASSGGTGQSAWAADDDVGKIDETLIELELKWRVLQSLGKAYADQRLEAEDAADRYYASESGDEIIDMAPERFVIGAANIPDTGFG